MGGGWGPLGALDGLTLGVVDFTVASKHLALLIVGPENEHSLDFATFPTTFDETSMDRKISIPPNVWHGSGTSWSPNRGREFENPFL